MDAARRGDWMTQIAEPIDVVAELIRCRASPVYFVFKYCRIKDERSGLYVPFELWPSQVPVLRDIHRELFLIILKARQLGITTLVVAYAVWLAIFKPGATILVFSKGQKEARDMLRKKIRTMIKGLPEWLQPAAFVVDQSEQLELSNGSRFVSFAARGSGGDSFTASLVIIDEADLIPDLDTLLSGAKPTMAAGGKLVMLSRADKSKPNSPFKRTFRAATEGHSAYKPVFLPWFARPERDVRWYEAEKEEIEARTGAADELYSNYPETVEQALAPRTLDRRFPMKWLEQCYEPGTPLPLELTPFAGVSGAVRVYELPRHGREYIVGVDVALGNPNSDDSVSVVLERASLRQVAVLCGKHEPGVIAHYAAKIAGWYNRAWINVERNNHGITTVAELRKLRDPSPRVLAGRDNKLGWWTDRLGKSMMYDAVAESLRCGSCTIRDKQTLDQLTSLEIGTLEAPEGDHDDCAVAFGLALHGAATPVRKGDVQVITFSREPEAEPDQSRMQGPPSPVAGVEWFEAYGEWWVRLERDGERLDLYGSPDKAAAEAAGRAATALRAMQGPVLGPLSDDAIDVHVYQVLRDRGWIEV